MTKADQTSANKTTSIPASGNNPTSGVHLNALLEHALKDIYYAEKKIHKSLPKMIAAAGDPALKAALTTHRDETAGQISVLEQVFENMGITAKAEKCDAIDGILDESEGLLDDFGGTDTADAAIIFSCQAIEHYEITRYGSLCAFAKALGKHDAAKMLGGILAQEQSADKALTAMAEGRINKAAA
jgi:ferritin-like metal-binding protein YciE